MKLCKTLLCAALAGTVALVSHKAKATVISNILYVPLNLKVVYSYVDNNKIRTVRYTSKNTLEYLYGSSKGLQLTISGSDVYVINKTSVIDDLTAEGILFVTTDRYISTLKNKPNGAYKYSEAGQASLDFYSDGFTGEPASNNYSVVLNGTYTFNQNASAVKNGTILMSTKFKTKNLSGHGYDFPDAGDTELPVTGSASGGGGGKVPPIL